MILAVPIGLLAYTLYQDGAFETTINSVMILAAGINRFRSLKKEDLSEVGEMAAENRDKYRKLKENERE